MDEVQVTRERLIPPLPQIRQMISSSFDVKWLIVCGYNWFALSIAKAVVDKCGYICG